MQLMESQSRANRAGIDKHHQLLVCNSKTMQTQFVAYKIDYLQMIIHTTP